MKLPLPPDAFSSVPLDADKVDELKKIAHNTVQQVLDCVRLTNGPIAWTRVADEKVVHVYFGVDAAAPPSVTSWLGVSEVVATLDEVSALLYSSSTADYRNHLRLVFNEAMDGVRIANLVTPTPENPRQFVGVNWVVQKAPGNGILVKHRDWCYVESHQDAVLVDGRHAWVRAMTSVDLPACPPLPPFVRGRNHRSGIVFVETDRPGTLQVLQLMQLDICGDVSRVAIVGDYLTQLCVKKRFRTMVDSMERALRSYRMGQSGQFAPDVAILTSNSTPTHCRLCTKKFGIMTKASKCRKCAQVVCRHETCSACWDVKVDGELGSHRICTVCWLAASRQTSRAIVPSQHQKTQGGSSWESRSRDVPWMIDGGSSFSHKVVDPIILGGSDDDDIESNLDTCPSTVLFDSSIMGAMPQTSSTVQLVDSATHS
ncbi:hypothetical protein, variant [Aphanomyces invadans]|nr:hypothetical protein, variant [Aphanomyces invadans]ETW07084.1 hypothetical protein, variant [Aphanomyces invadans]|eukprot:XP_008865159.1 hypothetical protein, variant [Aphanomyces invadans]